MRKASVTPTGMPACRKPMKSGTAEHEQNGVTTPKSAAETVPDHDAPTGQRGTDPLGGHIRAQEADQRHDAQQEQQHLGHVVEEEGHGLAERAAVLKPEQVEGDPLADRPGREPGHQPGDDRKRGGRPERQVMTLERERAHQRTRASASEAAATARPRRARSTSTARRPCGGWLAPGQPRADGRGGC